MTIPRSTLVYILLQRTGYAPGSLVMRRLPPLMRARINALLYPAHIKQKFAEGTDADWHEIAPHLPKTIHSALDIGCGIAGIEIPLSKRFDASLTLLDREQMSPSIWYNFEDEGSAYNSLAEARRLLELNGVPSAKIHMVNIDSEVFPSGPFDVVLSLISWGWHYPIKTYLDDVCRTLSPGGTLVIDVRRDTGGEEELAEKFSLTTISENKRGKRIVGRLKP